jgi:hypothetical protein
MSGCGSWFSVPGRSAVLLGRLTQHGLDVKRQKHSIETDYLNGEITLLGRVHGVPTPVNDLLQRLASQMAREGKPPGSMAVEEVIALLPSGCV